MSNNSELLVVPFVLIIGGSLIATVVTGTILHWVSAIAAMVVLVWTLEAMSK